MTKMDPEQLYASLAAVAMKTAEQRYGEKDARFDVIVECMSTSEIAAELKRGGVTTEAGAHKWAERTAGLHHEVELNQAWDGPESCVGSSRYQPEADPAGHICPACGKPGCNEDCAEMRRAMADPVSRYIDSYTGHPHYSTAPGYDDGDPPEPTHDLFVGPEFADDVSLEERWQHYAFEERMGMPYGSSF